MQNRYELNIPATFREASFSRRSVLGSIPNGIESVKLPWLCLRERGRVTHPLHPLPTKCSRSTLIRPRWASARAPAPGESIAGHRPRHETVEASGNECLLPG